MANAPKQAPAQPVAQTGKGPLAKGSQPAAGGLAPRPRTAATTGPKIASPSVDYDTQQGNRQPSPVGPPGLSTSDQQQQLQDKGGA